MRVRKGDAGHGDHGMKRVLTMGRTLHSSTSSALSYAVSSPIYLWLLDE